MSFKQNCAFTFWLSMTTITAIDFAKKKSLGMGEGEEICIFPENSMYLFFLASR